MLTFICVFVVDGQVEVRPIPKATHADYFPLQIKYRYARSIESYPGWFLLGLEFEENGGRHNDRLQFRRACDIDGTRSSGIVVQ